MAFMGSLRDTPPYWNGGPFYETPRSSCGIWGIEIETARWYVSSTPTSSVCDSAGATFFGGPYRVGPHVLAEMDGVVFGHARPQHRALVTAGQRGRMPPSGRLMAIPSAARDALTRSFGFAHPCAAIGLTTLAVRHDCPQCADVREWLQRLRQESGRRPGPRRFCPAGNLSHQPCLGVSLSLGACIPF